MPQQKYSSNESMNRLLRLLQGETLNEQPGTVPAPEVSQDEALSQITELLAGTLEGYTFHFPTGTAPQTIVPVKYLSVTGTYTVSTADGILRCSGTFNVALPAALATHDIYVIKNVGAGTIMIIPHGSDTMDGNHSGTLSQWNSNTLFDGAIGNWDIY
jgi:hypothetical protein